MVKNKNASCKRTLVLRRCAFIGLLSFTLLSGFSMIDDQSQRFSFVERKHSPSVAHSVSWAIVFGGW